MSVMNSWSSNDARSSRSTPADGMRTRQCVGYELKVRTDVHGAAPSHAVNSRSVGCVREPSRAMMMARDSIRRCGLDRGSTSTAADSSEPSSSCTAAQFHA